MDPDTGVFGDIWHKLLPGEYGGDESFYDNISTTYENIGQLSRQCRFTESNWTDKKNAWDDGTIETGIKKALDFIERHKTQN